MQERRADEKRVDSAPDRTGQAADGVLGAGEQPYRNVVQRQVVRHRIRDEAPDAVRELEQPAGAFRREIGGAHAILGSTGIGCVISGFAPNLK